MKRVFFVLLVVCVAVVLLYLSRFWPFQLWTRNSTLGELGLRPTGDMIRVWLRGTAFAPFDLLIWGVTSILILSGLERVIQRFK